MKHPRVDVGRIRREQIVEAAAAVIAEEGLQNLSLSAIEERAGMSRGQLTYYFPAKEDILLAVFDRLLEMMHARVRAGEGDHPCHAGGSPWERLEHFLTFLVLQPPAWPEFHALQYTFLSQIGHRDDFRKRLASLYEEWRTHLAADLAPELARRGAGVSPRTVATFVQALLHGLAMQRAADPDAYDRHEMLALCLEMLGHYLAPAGNGAPAGDPEGAAEKGRRNPLPRNAMNNTGERARPDGNGAASLSDRVRGLRLPDGGGRTSSGGRALPWALCVILLVVSAAFGYRAYRVSPAAPAGEAAPAATTSAAPGTTAVAASGDVVLQAKGYVIPAHQVQVSPKVGGMILELHRDFLEGRFFKADEILAELEDVDYRADCEHARAALAAARHRYEELSRSWPKEVEQAQRELDESRATREQLQREMIRNQRLIGDNAVPQREYEQAKFGYDAMARRVERLEVALWLMKEGPRKEKVEAAQRDVEAARADLDKADWRLKNCKIRAPISGHILTKKAEKGNVVNPLAFNVAASLCEMANLADLEVDLSVQERDIAAISSEPDKQPCTVLPEAYQNNEPFRKKHPQGYRGVVSRQMPIADRSKGAIQVRVKVLEGEIPPDEVGLYLKPDMSVLVSFFRVGAVPREDRTTR